MSTIALTGTTVDGDVYLALKAQNRSDYLLKLYFKSDRTLKFSTTMSPGVITRSRVVTMINQEHRIKIK